MAAETTNRSLAMKLNGNWNSDTGLMANNVADQQYRYRQCGDDHQFTGELHRFPRLPLYSGLCRRVAYNNGR